MKCSRRWAGKDTKVVRDKSQCRNSNKVLRKVYAIMPTKLTGLADWQRDMRNQIKRIPGATAQGLISAGLILQAEAQKLTPVASGNLRASAFTIWEGGENNTTPSWHATTKVYEKNARGGWTKVVERALTPDELDNLQDAMEQGVATARGIAKKMRVVVGFGAAYSVFVHEIDAEHRVGQWKFLETAAYQNMDRMINAIVQRARA